MAILGEFKPYTYVPMSYQSFKHVQNAAEHGEQSWILVESTVASNGTFCSLYSLGRCQIQSVRLGHVGTLLNASTELL